MDLLISQERYGWLDQQCHKHWMPLDTTLEVAYEELLSKRLQYSVLLHPDSSVHCMVSFQRLSNVLSLRYGQELYAHAPVAHIEIPARLVHGSGMVDSQSSSSVAISQKDILFIAPDTDLIDAVRKFNERTPEHYFDDLVVVNSQGGYEGLLSVIKFNSIHSRYTKAQEERLENQNRMLKETLENLSRTQAELVAKSKMASLGELIAGIAHEMNTPLGILLSSHEIIEISLEKLGSETNQAKVDRLHSVVSENRIRASTASTRVCSIINSLKVFGRNVQEEMYPADINELITSTITLMGNLLRSGVEVNVEFHDDPCPVDCHADQIGQVLLNVVNNAIQAMDGQGSLSITAAREGLHARVTIRDTGPGIPPDKYDRIFDPGFTTKGVGVGTGLGLSISRKIIEENHSGHITASNHPQGGAVFVISIPLKQIKPSHISNKDTHE